MDRIKSSWTKFVGVIIGLGIFTMIASIGAIFLLSKVVPILDGIYACTPSGCFPIQITIPNGELVPVLRWDVLFLVFIAGFITSMIVFFVLMEAVRWVPPKKQQLVRLGDYGRCRGVSPVQGHPCTEREGHEGTHKNFPWEWHKE